MFMLSVVVLSVLSSGTYCTQGYLVATPQVSVNYDTVRAPQVLSRDIARQQTAAYGSTIQT